MKIMAIGLNHQTAPLELREQVTIGQGEMSNALNTLRDSLGKGVILSTCNRSEVYSLVASQRRGVETLKEFFTACHNVTRREIEPYLYVYHQNEAVRHLFRVASGLDSLIVGEAQILGQVRDAYAIANQHGMAGGALSRLLHQALRVGKRARRETDIGRNAISVSRAAVEMARKILGDLKDKSVLVVGLGDAGKMAARALANAGVTKITVTNRTYKMAEEIATELGGVAIPIDVLEKSLSETDIIVSATGSPGYVITPELLTRARGGDVHPLLLVDIALPRDIDPAVTRVPGVNLLDIDNLETVAAANRRHRSVEAQKVESIVTEEVGYFMSWLVSLEVVPTVAALREQAEDIRFRELDKVLKRLPRLTEDEQARLVAFSHATVNKLLHQPIVSLKENRDPAFIQMVRYLFGLSKDKVKN